MIFLIFVIFYEISCFFAIFKNSKNLIFRNFPIFRFSGNSRKCPEITPFWVPMSTYPWRVYLGILPVSVHQILVFSTLNTGCIEITGKIGHFPDIPDFPDFSRFLVISGFPRKSEIFRKFQNFVKF